MKRAATIDLAALRVARAKLIGDLERRKASHARRAKIAAELAAITVTILRAEIDAARSAQPKKPSRTKPARPQAAADLFAAA